MAGRTIIRRQEYTVAKMLDFINERAAMEKAIKEDGRECRSWEEFEKTYFLAEKHGVLSIEERKEFYSNAPTDFAENRFDHAHWTYGTGIRNQLLEEYVLGVRARARKGSPEDFQALCDERIGRITNRGRTMDERDREFRALMRGDREDPRADRDVMAEFEAGIASFTRTIELVVAQPIRGLGPHEYDDASDALIGGERAPVMQREEERSL